MLETGCTQMARWRAVHPQAEHAFIAVNVSPRQLESAELVPALREALAKSELPAGALMLEITESGIVADDTRMHRLLNELREFGVRLAIDDFGTGYSSLSYLKRLPVSHLKIDRSFVNGLGTDTEDERIVAAVTELGHGLGLAGSWPRGSRTASSASVRASSGATSIRDSCWPSPAGRATSLRCLRLNA